MFTNLDRELNNGRISWRAAAKAIDMPEATFRSKIKDGNFSIDEAFNIKKMLFPQFELEYLFEKT